MQTKYMGFRASGLLEYAIQVFLDGVGEGTHKATAAVCLLAAMREEAESMEQQEAQAVGVGAIYDELDGCCE